MWEYYFSISNSLHAPRLYKYQLYLHSELADSDTGNMSPWLYREIFCDAFVGEIRLRCENLDAVLGKLHMMSVLNELWECCGVEEARDDLVINVPKIKDFLLLCHSKNVPIIVL